MTKFYTKIGRLPDDTISYFRDELLRRKDSNPYQWIQFGEFLNKKFLEIFENTDLQVQWDLRPLYKRPIQKGLYSEPGHGYRIHKDGIRCKSALNIVLSCNDTDWVRWYDEDYINSRYGLDVTNFAKMTSRNVNCFEYEDVPYISEMRNTVGEVYVLDTDTYHSFKCIGSQPRLVVQTKFDGFPDYSTVLDTLSKKSFSNLLPL